MAVPFSNTHLRVPRGFGTILEGLAREVLRDQPDDIPAYAAQYFDTLLKQREESGMDPAEWAAKLEDRFYNNHVFKNTQSTALKETASVTISKEQLYESQTEDESSHPAEASVLSTTQPPVSENAESTEVTDDEEINITTEEATVLAEEKQLVGDRQSVDENGSDEENDLTQTELDQIDRSENEMDVNRVLDENIPQFHPEPRENSNVNLSSLEFGVSENAGGNLQGIEHVNVENKDSDTEENSQVSDAVKTLPYSGLADVNVCAAELEVTQETKEGSTFQDNTDVEVKESTNLQHEETVAEMTLGGKQDSEDRAQKINESDKTEAEVSYEETNESLGLIEPDLDNNVTLKDDSLAETSFEDVPETQHISEDGEKKNMTDASIEILQNNVLEMQQRDESVELTAHSAGQDVAHTDHQLKPEAEIVMTEYERDVQSHQSASDFIKETVDTNSSNLNDSEDGEKKTGVKGISLSDQPTTETEKEIQEHEADHKDTEEISVETLNQNQLKKLSDDPDFDVKINTGGKDEEEKCTEPYNEMGDPEIIDGRVEQDPSSAVESNQSGVGMEAEEEIFEESPRVVGKSLPEDLKEEKNVICEEAEEYSRIKTDSVVREQTEGIEEEETISLTRSGDWTAADQEEEERPHECEDDATASANKNDKEECSRPQEEEDIMDIPLDDPEANRAAAKIQAGFRGHMTRKKMKPEDKTEGEEVSSTGDVLGSSQGVSETGRSGAVESDDTSVPEQ